MVTPDYVTEVSQEDVNAHPHLATHESRRLAIAWVYVNKYHKAPPSEWDGRDGTILAIMESLGLKKKSQRDIVKTVLERTWNDEPFPFQEREHHIVKKLSYSNADPIAQKSVTIGAGFLCRGVSEHITVQSQRLASWARQKSC